MHYSQKRRYYFFIAIAKFKTVLSYYPRCLSFAQPSLILRHILGCASSPTFLRLSFAYPSLILRLSFAQGSLKVRLSFAQPSLMIAPHLRHTCATHFGKLSEFAKVNRLPAGASPPPYCLSFAQPSLILRSTFAQGSMRRILNFELMGLLGLVGLLGLLGVRAAQADFWDLGG